MRRGAQLGSEINSRFTQIRHFQDALRAIFETFSTPLTEQHQKISTRNPKGTS